MPCTSMEVNVYVLPHCSVCKMTKEFLKTNKISFIEYDVSKDRQAANAMIEKSGQQQVPVVDVDGTLVIGFEKDKLEELLGL